MNKINHLKQTKYAWIINVVLHIGEEFFIYIYVFKIKTERVKVNAKSGIRARLPFPQF
jgi:hypothetical protein